MRRILKVELSHVKNPVLGWDVLVKAAAYQGEKISSAKVVVNGRTIAQESLNGVSSWNRTFTQQGYYPGKNTVTAEITNNKGDDTLGEDTWE
jgi:hypothetical protein